MSVDLVMTERKEVAKLDGDERRTDLRAYLDGNVNTPTTLGFNLHLLSDSDRRRPCANAFDRPPCSGSERSEASAAHGGLVIRKSGTCVISGPLAAAFINGVVGSFTNSNPKVRKSGAVGNAVLAQDPGFDGAKSSFFKQNK